MADYLTAIEDTTAKALQNLSHIPAELIREKVVQISEILCDVYNNVSGISEEEIETITKRVLSKDCIEDCVTGDEAAPPSPHLKPYELKINTWPITSLADDGLMQLSKDKDLFLNIKEMQAIRDYYRQLKTERCIVPVQLRNNSN